MSEEQTYQWVIVEMMGRTKLAGRYSFENGLHRVDVPTDDPAKFHTKMLGNSAIFQIHFCDEDAARLMARQFRPEPIGVWELRKEMKRLHEPAGAGEVIEGGGDDDDAFYDEPPHWQDYDDEEDTF